MVTPQRMFSSFTNTVVEKIASFDRGWLQAKHLALRLGYTRVEKIASFDRGWLQKISNAITGTHTVVEKIASFDRGWLPLPAPPGHT